MLLDLRSLQERISGALSKNLGALTLSSTATVAIAGATTRTLAPLTLSALGTVQIKGSTTATLGSLTLSSAATLKITGATARMLGVVTLLASGGVAAAEEPSGGGSGRIFGPARTKDKEQTNGALAVVLESLTLSSSGIARTKRAQRRRVREAQILAELFAISDW